MCPYSRAYVIPHKIRLINLYKREKCFWYCNKIRCKRMMIIGKYFRQASTCRKRRSFYEMETYRSSSSRNVHAPLHNALCIGGELLPSPAYMGD